MREKLIPAMTLLVGFVLGTGACFFIMRSTLPPTPPPVPPASWEYKVVSHQFRRLESMPAEVVELERNRLLEMLKRESAGGWEFVGFLSETIDLPRPAKDLANSIYIEPSDCRYLFRRPKSSVAPES
jgi:hypothetical protein